MKKKLILIAGPTAVGKTDVSLELARHFQTEIISADSRQCFKEMVIGVARPSNDALLAIPHHFIASHSIADAVTAATFANYANPIVNQLFQQHDTVVMTGGTGLYLKAFTDGLDLIPEVPLTIRMQIQRLYDLGGLSKLQEAILTKDPFFAATGELQNPQRIMRALEVVEATGTSIIHFRKGIKKKHAFDIIRIGLDLPREQLYQQINHRVDQMMQAGLLDEVKSLLPHRHLNALQTVGYKELFEYLDGSCTITAAVDQIKQHTRHYAKRQLTWFRRQEQYRWLHPSQLQDMIKFVETINQQPDSPL